MEEKKGVLFMAYGSPNKLEDIEPYYTDIRKGRKPSPELLEELTERYLSLGGSTPLLKLTIEQMESLKLELGPEYHVYLGMRHWFPWVHEAVEVMKNDGITKFVGLVMAPHYSTMSIAKYVEQVEKGFEKHSWTAPMKMINNWHVHPQYLNALRERIEEARVNFSDDQKESIHYIFTAHSLPERVLQVGDPYKDQLMETCRLLAEMEGIENWTFAFQSAGRTEEKWLGPDLLNVLDDLDSKGVKNVLICSVGFIIDHLEVMYDIDIEAQDHVKDKGMTLYRAPSLNDHPNLAKLFAELIKLKFEQF